MSECPDRSVPWSKALVSAGCGSWVPFGLKKRKEWRLESEEPEGSMTCVGAQDGYGSGSTMRIEKDGMFSRPYDIGVKLLPVWKTWLKRAIPHIQGPRVLKVSFGTGSY